MAFMTLKPEKIWEENKNEINFFRPTHMITWPILKVHEPLGILVVGLQITDLIVL